jgi:hypothetical protein
MKTFGDMNQQPARQILARIYGGGRGNAFTQKTFADISGGATVRKVLERLTRDGKIRRLLRGVYDYPAFSRVLDAPASPDPHAIARAIARAHGWTTFPTGNTALNLLGLSTQVPARWEYLSDGPSKRYIWAGGTVIFKQRTNRETTILSARTGLLVQALKALGQERIDEHVMATLRKQFSARERARAVREARYATAWVYEAIKRLDRKGTQEHA